MWDALSLAIVLVESCDAAFKARAACAVRLSARDRDSETSRINSQATDLAGPFEYDGLSRVLASE